RVRTQSRKEMAEGVVRHREPAEGMAEAGPLNGKADVMEDPMAVTDPAPPAALPAPAEPRRPALLPWLGLALLLALQYGMFRQYAEREVTWCYPRGYDQTVYLARSYACYEHILKEGPLPGVLWALRQPVANGLLLEAEAGLLFLVLGPSRLT